MLARYLVPAFDGAYFSGDQKEALWDRFYTEAPQLQRRSVERAGRHGVNPKTVAKWKKRGSTADLRTGRPSGMVMVVRGQDRC